MNLAWTLTLNEPSDQATMLNVAGTFEFTEDVIPDPVKTAEADSMRLLQISTMFINNLRHDVDAFRFRNSDGVVTVDYDSALPNSLLPVIPSSLHPETLRFDSLHTDDVGQPNGNTPSYRIIIHSTTGPMSGPITVRAFFNSSQNLNHDSLGLCISIYTTFPKFWHDAQYDFKKTARRGFTPKRPLPSTGGIYFKFQGKTNIKAAWFALFE
jgi:hypothetical protein